MKIQSIRFLSFYFFACLLDFITTIYGLKLGFSEGNPLANLIIQHSIFTFTFTYWVTISYVSLMFFVQKRFKWIFQVKNITFFSVLFIGIGHFICGINNIFLIVMI